MIACSIIVILGFTFRPIRNIDKSQCATASGVIQSIHESGTNDVTFSLENRTSSFYINRGLENGFDLGAMQDTLIGKPVKIWYVHQYSLLTLISSHVSSFKYDVISVNDDTTQIIQCLTQYPRINLLIFCPLYKNVSRGI